MSARSRASFALALVAAAAPAAAQVPNLLGYQGRLLRADGTAATGTASVTFTVFDAATGGSALWFEAQTLGLSDGYYSTLLGLVTPVPDAVFAGGPRWLEVKVGGEALAPRQQIGAAPYALAARSVRGGGADVTSLSVQGSTVIDSAGRLAGTARYAAGAGLVVDDTTQTLSLLPCPAGRILLRGDGTWQCAMPNPGTVTSVEAEWPLAVAGGTDTAHITLPQAATNASGYLSSTDWTAFSARYGASTQCGGDLSGTLATPVVARLQTRPIAAAQPQGGQVLKWGGSQWEPAADANSGGTLTGLVGYAPLTVWNGSTVPEISLGPAGGTADGYLSSTDWSRFDAKYGSATQCGGDLAGTLSSPLVARLQGVSVASTVPAASQVLRFDGTRWAPASLGIADVGGLSSGYLDLSGAQAISGAKSFQTAPSFGTPLPVASGGIGATTASAGEVFAGPATGSGAPAFRALAQTDLPALDASKTATGTFDPARIPALDASAIATGTLAAERIPAGVSITGSAGSVAWSGVTGTPTTLSGYGIADAFPATGTLAGLVRSTAAGSSYFTGGSLGVGTTSPAAKTHLADSASGSGELLRLENAYSTGSQSGIGFIGNGLSAPQTRILGGPQNSNGSGAFAVYNTDPTGASYQSIYATNDYNDAQGQRVAFSTGAAERMRVDGQGRVGVGTTSPDARLTVLDGAGKLGFGVLSANPTLTMATGSNVYDDIVFNTFGADQVRLRASSYGLAVGGANPRLNIGFPDANYTSAAMVVNGSVGVGTTVPHGSLELAGQAGQVFNVNGGGAGQTNWRIGGQVLVDGGFEITPSTAAGGFTFSTPALVAKSNGNVGVGTTTPGARLDVAGTAKATLFSGDGSSLGFWVNDIQDWVAPIAFRKALYTAPYTKVINAAYGNGGNFPTPSVWSENDWNWSAADDAWIGAAPPSGYTKAYARVTMSLYNPSNHSPCFWLRREYYNDSTGGGDNTWKRMTGDKDVRLGCFSVSTRATFPASGTVWAPWWNTDLTLVAGSTGGAHQRLLISAESNWSGETAGSWSTIIYGAEIELFASNSSVVQGQLPNGSNLVTGGATGTIQSSANTVVKSIP